MQTCTFIFDPSLKNRTFSLLFEQDHTILQTNVSNLQFVQNAGKIID